MRCTLAALALAIAACATSPEPLPHERAGPEIANPYPPPSRAPASLRVVTFNIARGADEPRLAREILDDRRLRDADVFLLQEVESHPYEDVTRTARLAAALRLNYAYVPARSEGDEGGSHGLAILSRYPMSDVRSIALPHFDLPITQRQRIAVAARIDVAGTPVQLYDVHLDTRLNSHERIAQLEPVLDDLAEADGVAVVGGDFNTNPYSWSGHLIPTGRSCQDRDLDRAMRRAGFLAPTARSGSTHHGVLRMRLDSVFVRGADVTATGVARGVTVSDHYPVWVDVKLDR